VNGFLRALVRRLEGETGCHNATARTRWVEARLRAIPPGHRLLDAGAGRQPFREACAHLRYVAQDFGKYEAAPAGVGLQRSDFAYGPLDVVSDVAAIPEADASFDAILCTEVLEHVPAPEAALREFARLLRPGGALILTAPFCSLTHYAPYHYATGFSRFYYEHHLPRHGFRIVEIVPNGNYFGYLAQELRRLQDTAARYAGVRGSVLERAALAVLLRALSRFERRDRGSAELLCFGHHVHAIRDAAW
jgi:ubiquinone/menaquinone biosynthesis C-methylase UbiE